MKVVYLTWGETPRSYGVFGSQVIGQFVASKQQMADSAEFSFISAVPIVHSGFVREKLNYFTELNKVRKILNLIPFSIIPIYAPQNLVNSTKNTFPFMHFGAHWHLNKKLQFLCPDIVHCRSYHAAWAALIIRNELKLSYKIIFDARGLWPEEMALKNNWEINNENFLYLKSIENKLLSQTDVTVSVSDPMTEHYLSIGVKNIKTIYLSAPVNKLSDSSQYISSKDRKNTSLCYVGALEENSWHQPICLAKLYKKFRACVLNPKLVIVTTSNQEKIRKEFLDIPKEELYITISKSPDELAKILNNIDFAALPYRITKENDENLIAKTMLATKTVEYLSAGLPVLVNKQCEGAAAIITNYNLGIVYDPFHMEEISSDNLNKYNTPETSQNAKKIAKSLFDYEANAERYCNLYDSLL